MKRLLLSLFFCLVPFAAMAQVPQPQCPSQNGSCLYSYKAANATTTIKTGPGVLHSISITTAGATDTITVYDNTAGSGTIIALINDALTGTYTFDVGFTTGLTIVIAGTTAPSVTVSYL